MKLRCSFSAAPRPDSLKEPFKSLQETSDKVNFNSKVNFWDGGLLKGSAQLVVNYLQGNEVFSCWLPVPLSPLSGSA